MITVQPITPIGLIKGLAERIRTIVRDHQMEMSDARGMPYVRTPNVILQHLPEKQVANAPDDADMPFVLVALDRGVINDPAPGGSEDAGAIDVVIVSAGYDDGPDQQGWMIPVELTWRILTSLAENPVIGSFKMQHPFSFDVPVDYSPLLHWYSAIRMTWSAFVPKKKIDLENWDFTYGNSGGMLPENVQT